MKNIIIPVVFILLMTSCIPDDIKDKMNKGMAGAQQMMADWEFKKAISQIELHKLRNGNYPNSLRELKFLSAMDSSMFNFVEYTRRDSVYELNLKMKFSSIDGKEIKEIHLKYPPEFWKGLGCIKSNVR
jgi:hypothetical protein